MGVRSAHAVVDVEVGAEHVSAAHADYDDLEVGSDLEVEYRDCGIRVRSDHVDGRLELVDPADAARVPEHVELQFDVVGLRRGGAGGQLHGRVGLVGEVVVVAARACVVA